MNPEAPLCYLFVVEMLTPGCAASHPAAWCTTPCPGCGLESQGWPGPKPVRSLDLLPFVNSTCATAQGDREFSLSAFPCCHGDGSSEDHHYCMSWVVMLHCGQVDQWRGKGYGLKAGNEVKGRPPLNSYIFLGNHQIWPPRPFPWERETNNHVLPPKWQPASKTTRMLVNLSLAAHTGRDNSGLNSYDFWETYEKPEQNKN